MSATKVTTWADGFGRWWAKVEVTDRTYHLTRQESHGLAQSAIREELLTRGEMDDSFELRVELFEPRMWSETWREVWCDPEADS